MVRRRSGGGQRNTISNRLKELLRLRETWRHAGNSARQPTGRFLATLRFFRRKWQQDRENARAVAARLLNMEPREWRRYIQEHEETRTAGVVEAILEAVDGIDLPIRRRELTALATELAAQLDESADHPVAVRGTRGRAWRFLASDLEALTRYRDALDACDRAAAEFETLPAFAHEMATVSYVKATVFMRMGDLDAALPHVRYAVTVYRDYGETELYLKARNLEGYLLHSAGRSAESLALWKSLIAEARALDDQGLLAALHGNIGTELWRMGELDRATWYLRTAVRMATKAGLVSDLPRIRLNLARVSVARRNYEKALDQFWRVVHEFAALGMTLASENARLEIAEVLLVLRRTAEAREICLGLTTTFIEGGLPQSALQAAAFLRECDESGGIEIADVVHVRLFMNDLPQDPARSFVPRRRAGR